ncbi:tryptophan synthase subunit alpha [Enterobacteriaceae endosymbiont of Neohaemonia nigricornis]|uniref:tryptophan synthase subunit alpha n=1 Tax=Enterobacteriaceae endosymbiont of Neohaemonia nigricornis TaxID=2675792 RepID=UPI001448C2B7|nr:tryptophan synthase subunit alpha [Enterobacteriaceae endosymbiont of Neohaemonia nigricornis]QJC30294.1 tryptophan synthase subunit alpha [Enterobacteriaceae endosymbiont of Neohaemonia nigricornis]
MNNRYNNMFKILKKKKEVAFIPFVTIGDPSITIFMHIIDILINNGADALELGIPFSDPIADGLIIQKSYNRVLKLNINIIMCFKIIKQIRKKYINIPIGILIYANIICSYGINDFYKQAYNAGIDSILIVDIPLIEYKIYYQFSKKYNILPVLLCPPNADNNFWNQIVLFQCAYIYVVSRSGITGYNIKNNDLLSTKQICKKIFKYHKSVPVQGFGIYNTDYIKQAIKNGVKGVIVGSFIINKINKYQHNPEYLFKKLKNIVINFKHATLYV